MSIGRYVSEMIDEWNGPFCLKGVARIRGARCFVDLLELLGMTEPPR